jgi:hypothetical protein
MHLQKSLQPLLGTFLHLQTSGEELSLITYNIPDGPIIVKKKCLEFAQACGTLDPKCASTCRAEK